MYRTAPLESFLEELLQKQKVKEEIYTSLGKEMGSNFFLAFEKGNASQDDMNTVHDIVLDFLPDNYKTEDEYTGRSNGDCFPILIKSLGPVFWVDAQEFDRIGYFRSLSDARICVEEEFADFLTEDGEDDDWEYEDEDEETDGEDEETNEEEADGEENTKSEGETRPH